MFTFHRNDILEGRKEHPNALRYSREIRARNQQTRKAPARARPKSSRKPKSLALV